MSQATSLKTADWAVPTGLILLSAIPVIAGAVRLHWLGSGGPVTVENARFAEAPLPVVLHIIGASLFCVLGAFQFSARIRARWLTVHKWMGRILAPAGLVAALSGLWMTLSYALPPSDNALLYVERLLFGSAMAASIMLGVLAILRRDLAAHRAWMMRGYALGVAAGTQALIHLPLLPFGQPDAMTRAILLGAAWVINLAVAEWLIRRRQLPAPRLAASTQPAH